MNTCAVTHDLNNYLARLEEEEAEAEHYQKIGEELISEFRTEGSCRIDTGPRREDFKTYDQSHLITNLFEYERSDKATEAFRAALDTSLTGLQRLQAAHRYFDLAEEQLCEDLSELATEVYEDDSP